MLSETFKMFLQKAKSPDPHEQYVALMFALTLPSLCSRVEFPRTQQNSGESAEDLDVLYLGKNGKPLDRRLCLDWFYLHKHHFRFWWLNTMPYEKLCNALFDLREQLSQTGSLLECANRLVLVEPGCLMVYCGNKLFMSIVDFCQDMFNVAYDVFFSNQEDGVGRNFDGISAEVLSEDTYEDLREFASKTYAKFWEGREEDLQLYKKFCRYSTVSVEELAGELGLQSTDGLFGLSRPDSVRMLKVAEEVQALDATLGKELALKYFSTPV